jgi:hypothetical protein
MTGDITEEHVRILRCVGFGTLVGMATAREVAQYCRHNDDGRTAAGALRALASEGLVVQEPGGSWRLTRSGREFLHVCSLGTLA